MFPVQNEVDWCIQSPCENGATCSQTGIQFQCLCRNGWTGDLCDVRTVTCALDASYRSMYIGDSETYCS